VDIKSFVPQKQFYESRLASFIRIAKELDQGEPIKYSARLVDEIFFKLGMTSKEYVCELEKLSYEEFMQMKENWLKTLRFVWFITGHLN